MADEEDLKINQINVTSQYVSTLDANDISDEEEEIRPRHSPVIAPMQFQQYQVAQSVPLKRRFFSTGAKRSPMEQQVEDKKEKYNEMVFASVYSKQQNAPEINSKKEVLQQSTQQNQQFNHTNSMAFSTSDATNQIVSEMSNSAALDQSQRSTLRKLMRKKPQSGVAKEFKSVSNVDNTNIQNQFKQQFQQFQTKQQNVLSDNILDQIHSTNFEDENILQMRPEKQQETIIPQDLSSSQTNKSKVLTRKKDPMSMPSPTQQKISLNTTQGLDSSYKYKEQNQTGNFTRVDFSATVVHETQQQFKNQFKAAENQAPGRPPIPQIRKTQSSYDPTQKQYNQQIIQQLFDNLDQKQDWAVRDAKLKEIARICNEQPKLLLEMADMAEFFKHCQKLLIDLRSALVTQTFETLLNLYQTYANLDYFNKHQTFIVALLKKAGNPSLPDFMVLQADAALLASVGNLITSLNYSNCGISLFLQQLSTEMKVVNTPGQKYRILYLITDLILIANIDKQGQLQELANDVLSRYGLQWSEQGINYIASNYQIENTIGQQIIQSKMIKQLSSLNPFINEQIKKLYQDANPEVRKAIRRLYFVCKVLGICTETYKKMEDIIQKEGVVDTWWGR